jgi:hypothetical protein
VAKWQAALFVPHVGPNGSEVFCCLFGEMSICHELEDAISRDMFWRWTGVSAAEEMLDSIDQDRSIGLPGKHKAGSERNGFWNSKGFEQEVRCQAAYEFCVREAIGSLDSPECDRMTRRAQDSFREALLGLKCNAAIESEVESSPRAVCSQKLLSCGLASSGIRIDPKTSALKEELKGMLLFQDGLERQHCYMLSENTPSAIQLLFARCSAESASWGSLSFCYEFL